MKTPPGLWLTVVLAMVFVAPPRLTSAQTSLQKQVASSGATTASSTNYQILGTAGQAAIGSATSTNFGSLNGFWEPPGNFPTSIGDNPLLPQTFRLDQNYPNPFNPTTTIRFALPRESHVVLRIFDVNGAEVAELVNESRPGGIYVVPFDGSSLASGVYFYRIEAPGFVTSRKLVLLK